MDDLRARLEARKRELQQQREQYIATAQRQIGAYDGAISEIERLLGELPQGDVEQKGEGDDVD